MSELDPIQDSEEGDWSESPTPESAEDQDLDDATYEPETQIEQTQSYEEAEAIQREFTRLVPDPRGESEPDPISSDAARMKEEEQVEPNSKPALEEMPSPPREIPSNELTVTVVGKGPVPTAPQDLESPPEGPSEVHRRPSEAVLDALARVVNDTEYRGQFLSDPRQALTEYELTPAEQTALESLQEERINQFVAEFAKRNSGRTPSQEDLAERFKAELTGEDLKRLWGED